MTTLDGAERIASSTTWAGRRTTCVSRVDLGAAAGEDLERLLVLDEHAGARQHLERREVDLAQLVGREDLEPEAAALARPRARVPLVSSARQPPAVRSLNRSTQLIGTSSTRAMLNLASIRFACHGWLIA